MKTKVFFICVVLSIMMMGLVSCEPTILGKKNVLINLAELGEKVDGKSVEEIEKILSKKGFAKFYDWSYERAGYFNRMCVYSNGIQLDSTCFEKDMTRELSQLEDNACVMVVDYFNVKGQTWVELAACYILPNNPTKDYEILSNNLYRYCSTKYSFKVSEEDHEGLAQGYMWEGDIETASSNLYYCNDDERLDWALHSGWITQEEYNEEIADYEGRFRKAFVKQLSQPYVEVDEEIYASSLTHDKYMYANLLMSNEYDAFFEANGITIAECYWSGPELDAPMPAQKRFTAKGRKAKAKFNESKFLK